MATIRRVKKSDFPELTTLIGDVLGREKSLDYWQWKYFSNPNGIALSVVALVEGKIVGLLGAIPVWLKVGGKEVRVAQEVDWAILEAYRGLELLLKMTHSLQEIMRQEGIACSYGISIPETAEISCALFGKIKIAPIPRFVKIINTKPFLKLMFTGPLSSCVAPLLNLGLKMKYPRSTRMPSQLKVRESQNFDARFNDFGEELSQNSLVMIKRNSAYLNWRYRDCPNKTYHIFYLEQQESHRIRGYIVLGIHQHNQHYVGQIMDFATIKENNNINDKFLLDFALTFFDKNAVDVVWCWMYEHCHQFSILQKRGFKKREKGQDLLFQYFESEGVPLPKKIHFATKKSNWYFAIGDCD